MRMNQQSVGAIDWFHWTGWLHEAGSSIESKRLQNRNRRGEERGKQEVEWRFKGEFQQNQLEIHPSRGPHGNKRTDRKTNINMNPPTDQQTTKEVRIVRFRRPVSIYTRQYKSHKDNFRDEPVSPNPNKHQKMNPTNRYQLNTTNEFSLIERFAPAATPAVAVSKYHHLSVSMPSSHFSFSTNGIRRANDKQPAIRSPFNFGIPTAI